MEKYKCPHCGKEIDEIRVFEVGWKDLLISAGFGVGLGLIVSGIMPIWSWVAPVGAFLVGFVVVYLLIPYRRRK